MAKPSRADILGDIDVDDIEDGRERCDGGDVGLWKVEGRRKIDYKVLTMQTAQNCGIGKKQEGSQLSKKGRDCG